MSEDWDFLIRFVRARLDEIEKAGSEGWLKDIHDPSRNWLLASARSLVRAFEITHNMDGLPLPPLDAFHRGREDALRNQVFFLAVNWHEHSDFDHFWRRDANA